ncbi:hypothetical protein AgCh_037515 [Apium graveolens]
MKTVMASADATSKTGFKGYQMGTQNVSLGVVTLGICISVGVGMSTAFQHLAHSPGVNLSKKKRLSFPELDLSSEVMASAGKKYGICKKLGQLNYNFIGQQSNAASPNPYQMFMDRGSIEVDDVYAFSVTSDIIMNSDPEPQSMEECRHRDDWPKWKIAIQEELQSLRKRNVFGPAVQTPAGVVPVGNRWETYSPVMDGVTFRFLIGMACMEKLETRLMDVVTAYLYGSLDIDIYMKIPEGLNIEDTKPRHLYSVKLQRSLYGLKQSGRMCTTEDITNAVNYLKNEFAMKDLGRTRFCLGIQVEHLSSGIFVHQSNYTEKILDRFYMDKAHPLTIPMVVRSLEVEKDPFRLRKQDEETLGPEVPYLSAIGALMYLANNTRPDIAFAVNLLARFSSDPTKRHWDGIKHIFRYLRGTIDLGLFFPNNSRSLLVGYADAGYMSNPHFGRSQIGYLFTYCDSAISWKSTKQTMTVTSSNHAELLAIHEASRECIWLRSVIQHIRESCGLSSISDSPTVLFEDNSACIKQLKEGYIKGDRTKHILPKFFYPHELQENGDIDIQQVRSCDNLADMLTKSLPTSTFEKLRNNMGMRRRKCGRSVNSIMDNLDVMMTDLDISNEENEEMVFDEEFEEENNRFELCLVGRFLTEKNLNVRAMKSKLADLWRPAMGISIKALNSGVFLFQFYHKDDLKWMLSNGPWSFDGAMLVVNEIKAGEDPVKVQLNEVEMWIQIYNLPMGYMTESVGKQLGNFFGKFISYDSSNDSSIWREYMRVRISLDVRCPLKRKKKISRKNKSEIMVTCKYEKLADFCFLCGLITHTERFCKKKFESGSEQVIREWGSWLRAPARRGGNQERSKWLRDDREDRWGEKFGGESNQGIQIPGYQQNTVVQRENREGLVNKAPIVENLKNMTDKTMEGNVNLNIVIGPGDSELDGLEIEERKRKRIGPVGNKEIVQEVVMYQQDPALSTVDCPGTSNLLLAQLAQQASHSP